MAYVNQEKKKELSVGIKSVLKKYGVKATIGVNHYSTLVVNIKSSKLDIIGNWFDKQTENHNRAQFDKPDKPEYIQVNEYWIEYNYTGIVKDFLNELLIEMKGKDYFNNDDSQSDYFHRSHYTSINVGKWNSPYIYEG
jgi:hypothetical protein